MAMVVELDEFVGKTLVLEVAWDDASGSGGGGDVTSRYRSSTL